MALPIWGPTTRMGKQDMNPVTKTPVSVICPGALITAIASDLSMQKDSQPLPIIKIYRLKALKGTGR